MGKLAKRIGLSVLVLLAALVVGLWVWSYWPPAPVMLADHPNSTWFLHLERGRAVLVCQWVSPAPPAGWTATTSKYGEIRLAGHGPTGWMTYDSNDLVGRFGFGHSVVGASVGFGNGKVSLVFSQNATYWMLPIWALLVVPAMLATPFWIGWLRRRRRRARGICVQCGYDLRATPGRCPECGLADSA